jgi:hypothetical protein
MKTLDQRCACGCGQRTQKTKDGWRRYRRGHNRRGIGKGWMQCGYKYISVGGAGIAEHRHVVEQQLGRKLKQGEVVHHVDHNPLNNDPANLVVLSRAEHRRLHAIKRSVRWSAEEKARARELHASGMTVQEVAAALERGFSSTIRHVCQRRRRS